jgi:hypothetical protein
LGRFTNLKEIMIDFEGSLIPSQHWVEALSKLVNVTSLTLMQISGFGNDAGPTLTVAEFALILSRMPNISYVYTYKFVDSYGNGSTKELRELLPPKVKHQVYLSIAGNQIDTSTKDEDVHSSTSDRLSRSEKNEQAEAPSKATASDQESNEAEEHSGSEGSEAKQAKKKRKCAIM